jgi:NAD(P)H-quinone oxidoreductase subunit 5
VHLAGHACFRLLQFLSAPNVLHDLHGLEEAIRAHGTGTDGNAGTLRSDRVRRRVFLIALERGFLDTWLNRVVVEPFTTLTRRLTRLDAWLSGAGLTVWRPAPADRGDRDE